MSFLASLLGVLGNTEERNCTICIFSRKNITRENKAAMFLSSGAHDISEPQFPHSPGALTMTSTPRVCTK